MTTKMEDERMYSTRYTRVERVMEEIDNLGDMTCIADGKKHAELYWKMVRAVRGLK